MITSLHLRNFKSFENASIEFGPLTLVVGTNAAGKSNLRDAIRFLVGVGRGYSLIDILEGKWGEGSVREWTGIRGGAKETARHRTGGIFEINCGLDLPVRSFRVRRHANGLKSRRDELKGEWLYSVVAASNADGAFTWMISETIKGPSWKLEAKPHPERNYERLIARISERTAEKARTATRIVNRQMPALSSLQSGGELSPIDSQVLRAVSENLRNVQFLDLAPDAMREPSPPGQVVLGDRGENLSSLLASICEEASKKRAILEWLRQLTPLDVDELDFVQDHRGYLMAVLVERDGTRTTAFSASDGTLRFLGMIAALFGPRPAKLYFIEELDTGIHPTRLSLLLDLIESRVKRTGIQVVATTHAPQLLGLLSAEARQHAVLVYRNEEGNSSQIVRIMDIPHVREALENRNLARLHESGWLENAMEFAAEEQA